MSTWLLSDLLQADPKYCGSNPKILGIASDSRQVRPGFLFLACRGTESHGLDFVDQAVRKGAVAVAWEPSAHYPVLDCALPCVPVPNLSRRVGMIASRFHGQPSERLFVLGVTGTDGKTSCSHLFAQAGARLGRRCGVLGTVGFGFLDDLQQATHTTPDPVGLQSWLARMVATGADSLAMEVSSHALDQGRINGVKLDVAVFTNLSRDHLDYHGDLRNYARAKRRLLDLPDLKALVINVDDDHGRQWATELSAAGRPVVAYGIEHDFEQGPMLRARALIKTSRGLAFELCCDAQVLRVQSGLIGHFNIYNLLAVAAAWQAAGCALTDIVQALAEVSTVPGRVEPFRVEDKPLVVVDYAHTPGALSQVLSALNEHREAGGRLICVFGCGGDRDRGKRPQMAAIAASLADELVLTDDNPRSESPEDIIADMLEGLDAHQAYRVIHDRAAAIAQAVAMAGPSDIVLVAGKGHEEYQQIGSEQLPFSDRQQVARALGLEDLACSA